jgi:hypothetical protein
MTRHYLEKDGGLVTNTLFGVTRILYIENYYPEAWVLTIETTGASQAYSINIARGTGINLTFDWGDGVVETITSTGNKSHTYAAAGTYYLHMSGSGEGLSIEQDSTGSYINATKVKATSAIRGITGIINFTNTFRNTRITSIPNDLFRNYPLASGAVFRLTFRDCISLTGSIPADLFRYNTEVTTLGFNETFRGCTGLTGSIPADLFRYNTKVSTTGFAEIFSGCTGLTGSIPADLFRYNTLVSTTGFVGTFNGCTNIEEAENGLFAYNNVCTSWFICFQNCNKLKLNSEIFYAQANRDTRFLNQSINFTSFINRASFTGVQGTAPDIWAADYGTGTPTTTTAFAGAGNSLTSLTNYGDIPAGWK